jgi:hypothetical protein
MGGEGASGRAALTSALVVWLAGGAVRAQEPDLTSLVLAAAASAARIVQGFTNVVAEEEYREWRAPQRAARRVRSDYLLVRFPGEQGRWLEFRDVREVNGRAVGDRDERITRLFLEPFDSGMRRAIEIGEASAEHLPLLYRPLLGVTYLQAAYVPAFRFKVGGVERIGGMAVHRLDFEHNPDVPLEISAGGVRVTGRAWLDAGLTGIVRTQLALGEGRSRVELVTSFGRDERLGIAVPSELQIIGANGQISGVLTYVAFKRFEVRTEQVITAPAGSAAPAGPGR